MNRNFLRKISNMRMAMGGRDMSYLARRGLLFVFSAFIVCICGCTCGPKVANPNNLDPAWRDGDVVLQHFTGNLTVVIADVTESKYSHCGMIVHRDGKPFVLEAMPPVVRYTPMKRWLDRGIGRQYTHLRPKDLTREQIAKAIKEAQKFLDKSYDFQYKMDDEKIYCSELIFKAYFRGPGVEIAKKKTLGDMKWKKHENYLRNMAGGTLPLDREIVSPEALVKSPMLQIVKTTYPCKN